MKVAKKEFACNGTVVEHPEYGEVRKLSLHFHVKFCVSLEHHLIIFTLNRYDQFRLFSFRETRGRKSVKCW